MGSTVSSNTAKGVTVCKQWSSPLYYTQQTVSAMRRKQWDPGNDTGKGGFP